MLLIFGRADSSTTPPELYRELLQLLLQQLQPMLKITTRCWLNREKAIEILTIELLASVSKRANKQIATNSEWLARRLWLTLRFVITAGRLYGSSLNRSPFISCGYEHERKLAVSEMSFTRKKTLLHILHRKKITAQFRVL